MSMNPLAKKLQIKPGYRVLLLNAPEGYRDKLQPLPEDVVVLESPNGVFDVVHLFVCTKDQVEEHGAVAIEAVKPGGLLWMSWPSVVRRLRQT